MNTGIRQRVWTAAIFLAVSGTAPALGQEPGNTDVQLATKLANPIASLVSVPLQFNYDSGYGPTNGDKAFVNIQPVIPFDLSADLSLVASVIDSVRVV